MVTKNNLVRFFIDDEDFVEQQFEFAGNNFCIPQVGENVLLHSADLPQYKVVEVNHWYDDNGVDMIDIMLKTVLTEYDME